MNDTQTSRDLLPTEALELYRQKSSPKLVEQTRLFHGMSDADRSELLFYMIHHNTLALQSVAPATVIEDVDGYMRSADG